MQIEGAYSFNLGNNLGVVEGSVRFEDFGTASVFGGNPANVSYQIGAHYLASLSDIFTIGGFEAVKAIGEKGVIFGQVGYGTSLENSGRHTPSGPLRSAGFYNGYFVRVGASHTGFGSSIFTLDLEYAETAEYEDSDELGVM